jgi:hypothetical protein
MQQNSHSLLLSVNGKSPLVLSAAARQPEPDDCTCTSPFAATLAETLACPRPWYPYRPAGQTGLIEETRWRHRRAHPLRHA